MLSRAKQRQAATNQDLCLVNHYAIEILESQNEYDPKQDQIDDMEHSLLALVSTDPAVKYISSRTSSNHGTILMVEHDDLLAQVHGLILANLGFAVECIRNNTDKMQQRLADYRAVFINIAAITTHGFQMTHLFERDQVSSESPVYLLSSSKGFIVNSNEIFPCAIQQVMTLPLFYRDLYDIVMPLRRSSNT